jgi:membrane protein YdbS with pleckstrin-like domain
VNKKTNTALFLLGATVFNLLLMFVLIAAALVLVSALFKNLNPNAMAILMVAIFIGAIAGSFLIYSRIIRWLSKKIDMEKYFMPIFRRKR